MTRYEAFTYNATQQALNVAYRLTQVIVVLIYLALQPRRHR